MVAPLRTPAHDPLSEPEVFWSDQVVGVGAGRTVSEAKSIGVHGLEANYVTIGDRSGSVVAVARRDAAAASTSWLPGAHRWRPHEELFSRLIRTFDLR